MNKRQYLVYGIFIVSVIYGIYYHFLNTNKIEYNNTPDPVEIQTAGFEMDDFIAVDIAQDTLPSGWGRNPFLPHESIKTPESENRYTDSDASIRLTGISYYEDGASFAVIDNKILQEGDRINQWQIISILENSVKVKNAYGIKTIKLGELN